MLLHSMTCCPLFSVEFPKVLLAVVLTAALVVLAPAELLLEFEFELLLVQSCASMATFAAAKSLAAVNVLF